MSSPSKLRLAIVGGGIGGLALAVAITRANIADAVEVDIYEAAPKLTQVGAGITLWPRGWEILKEFGLEDDLAAHISPGQEVPTNRQTRLAYVFRKSDHSENAFMSDLSFPGGSLSFHRADVQQVLVKHISPSVRFHLDKRLASYRETKNNVELVFKNGDTAVCDLLIGADGINSVVRKGFLSKVYNLNEEEAVREARPLWTGTLIYRCLIESEIVRQQNATHPSLTKPMVYCGKNKHVVTFPISAGKLINVVGFVSDPSKEGSFWEGPAVTSSTTDIVSSFFTNWSDEVQCIINNMSNPSRWAIETVKPLDKYGTGRVALLGDSAHAMPVHLGNGAGQAIEDAYILANLISKSSRMGHIDVEQIVDIYSTIRQPFGNFVAKASTEQGRYYEFATPDFDDIKEGDILPLQRLALAAERIAEGWRWTWDSSINNDLERALAKLHSDHV